MPALHSKANKYSSVDVVESVSRWDSTGACLSCTGACLSCCYSSYAVVTCSILQS